MNGENKMPVSSRSRMISFRVSAEEYRRLREICLANGIRNFSEMARTAVNVLLQQPRLMRQETLEYQLAELKARVDTLAIHMRELKHNATNGAGPSDSEHL